MLTFPALPGTAETTGGKIDPSGLAQICKQDLCLGGCRSYARSGPRQVKALRRDAQRLWAATRAGEPDSALRYHSIATLR